MKPEYIIRTRLLNLEAELEDDEKNPAHARIPSHKRADFGVEMGFGR